MEKTQKTLMTVYIAILVATIVLAALCELDILETGKMADHPQEEFITTTVMELSTLAGAFLGLRLFKFKGIHSELISLKAPALLKWGLVRFVLIEVPMLSNTLFYYMYMKPTFGYLAIILLLCLPFVWPSMSRCVAETTESEK